MRSKTTVKKIRLIIAGGRDFHDYIDLDSAVTMYIGSIFEWPYDITIISGCAKGADSLGERYANQRGINLERCPADWKSYGKGAGPIRNTEMAMVATHCICFWDGKSRGTKNMIDVAFSHGLGLRVVWYEK